MHRSAVVLVLLLAATGCGSSPDESGTAPVAASPTPSPFVQVHTGPVGLTAGEDGSVWVVGAQSDTVVRIPAAGAEPESSAELPQAVAARSRTSTTADRCMPAR